LKWIFKFESNNKNSLLNIEFKLNENTNFLFNLIILSFIEPQPMGMVSLQEALNRKFQEKNKTAAGSTTTNSNSNAASNLNSNSSTSSNKPNFGSSQPAPPPPPPPISTKPNLSNTSKCCFKTIYLTLTYCF
jgi:hypothetical protein